MDLYSPKLHISKSPAASATRMGENGWHLEIPAHNRFAYHLAQLDDHNIRLRSSFPWQPPLTFSLKARVSDENLPGTWGFGLWNDPFSFLIAYNRFVPRLPTLPEAAWFFHASPENYLSFRDDLNANGFIAGTFSSLHIPTVLLLLASPVLSLSLLPLTAQWLRKLLRRLVKQDAARSFAPLRYWHDYQLKWEASQVRFQVDGTELLTTNVSPRAPLSLVMWIDNQYAALPPAGAFKYGYLADPKPAWLELADIRVQPRA